MTRLTLRIIQDQLTRWVICLLGCAVLLSLNQIAEQKFNPIWALKLSFGISLHATLAWGLYHIRSSPKRTPLATASLGLPSVSWWGPLLLIWLAGSLLLYSGERHQNRSASQGYQAQLWPCTWRSTPSPHVTLTGVCFAKDNEQGGAQLSGWTMSSSRGPVTLRPEQLTQARPSVNTSHRWRGPLTRWVCRLLLMTLISSLLLNAPLERLGVCSLFSYALSWLFERALIH